MASTPAVPSPCPAPRGEREKIAVARLLLAVGDVEAAKGLISEIFWPPRRARSHTIRTLFMTPCNWTLIPFLPPAYRDPFQAVSMWASGGGGLSLIPQATWSGPDVCLVGSISKSCPWHEALRVT